MRRKLSKLVMVGLLLIPALAGSAALAAEVVVRVGVAPPAPRVEVITHQPSPAHFWVNGHWRWDGRKHVWVGGRWAASRPGQVWIRDHWSHAGNEWVYHPGHWAPYERDPKVVEVVTTTAPPALQVERVPAAPGPDYFWIAGHWRWEGARHVWVAGHWEGHRVEEVWVPAQWLHHGGNWTYVAGHWRHV